MSDCHVPITDKSHMDYDECIHDLEIFMNNWKKMPKWDLKDYIDMVNDYNHRVKDIEYRLNNIVELPNELDIRLQDVERILDKVTSKPGKTPHTCPVCDGSGTRTINIMSIATCRVCNGHGIVWG